MAEPSRADDGARRQRRTAQDPSQDTVADPVRLSTGSPLGQPETHRRGVEESRIHASEVGADAERDLDAGENVPFQVNARGQLRDAKPIGVEAEDAALRDVSDILAALA